ncbi:MAG: metal ABC transporter substrate-binding protein [Chloroflexota bacterium]|nr:metal ABC transporter substrate-binding protein [Chloroflexota bacterium]
MKASLPLLLVTVLALLLAACGAVNPPDAGNTGSSGSDAQVGPMSTRNTGSRSSQSPKEKLRLVTTVSPITNIVYNIAGERATVVGVVPEGTNSHTFEPAPSVARTLAAADLVFINGLNLEEPTLQLAKANKKASAEIVLLAEQTVTPDQYVYDFSFPREAGDPNPHLWTNPIHALRYAEIARDKLTERDPEGAEYYRKNYEAFKQRIDALDIGIKRAVESIPEQNRKLLTYHDSFAYFAPRYGMKVIGAIQPADFSEPSAREVATLIDQLRSEQVPAIFGSEVFPSRVLNQIAREAGVKYVDTLRDDDLPGKPGESRHSYVGLMVQDVEIMARSLGGDPKLVSSIDTSNVPGPDSAVEQPQ